MCAVHLIPGYRGIAGVAALAQLGQLHQATTIKNVGMDKMKETRLEGGEKKHTSGESTQRLGRFLAIGMGNRC